MSSKLSALARNLLMAAAVLMAAVACNLNRPSSSPSADGFVQVATETKLFYHIEGRGSDTVVVLHGGPAFGYTYMAPDLAPLTRSHVVVYYDQRGAGRSTITADSSRLHVDDHVQDLDRLRRHLGIGRMTLVGHSWGGYVAVRYAIAHPTAVRRLVLVEPMAPARSLRGGRSPRADSAAQARVSALFRAMDTAQDPVSLCRRAFGWPNALRIYFGDSATALRERGDFCKRPPDALRSWNRVVAATFGALGAWDIRPELPGVTVPVLVLRGTMSAIGRDAMNAWVSGVRNGRLVEFPDAGHYLYVEQPERFFAELDRFFRDT